MTELVIRVDSVAGIEDLGSLLAWLRRDQALIGEVLTRRETPDAGQMGGLTTVVVALGGGTSVSALARSLRTWMVQRRSDLTVEVSRPDGHTVRIDAKRINDVENLINRALNEPEATGGD